MRILITNDDGYKAKGLKILVNEALKYGEVIVVAPKVEQSGKSHAILIRQEMEFNKAEDIVEGVDTYYLDGSPADCVRAAYYYLRDTFDLVLSGVNEGYNVGEDIIYSGTVAAATEGAMLGKKAISLSTDYKCIEGIEKSLQKALEYVFKNKILDVWCLYNINMPLNSKGIKYSAQGKTHYTCEFEEIGKGIQSKGRPLECPDSLPYSDMGYTYEGFTTISPLLISRTNHEILKKLLNKD